jgi:putative membrane protein
VVATTAAGAGAYVVPDVDAREGLQLAAAAVPDLLTPFLEPEPAPATPAGTPDERHVRRLGSDESAVRPGSLLAG